MQMLQIASLQVNDIGFKSIKTTYLICMEERNETLTTYQNTTLHKTNTVATAFDINELNWEHVCK